MEIKINGEKCEIADGASIGHLISKIGEQAGGVAIALNDKVIKKPEWDVTILHPGDNVVIIKAAYGG